MAWYAKASGLYLPSSSEAIANVNEIYNILSYASTWSTNNPYDWTLNAVCALLGSVENESGYNPWRWQDDYVPSYAEYLDWVTNYQPNHAYGLIQFDPAATYIQNALSYTGVQQTANFSDITGTPQDGENQIKFVVEEMSSEWYDFTGRYPITFQQFATGNYNLYDLTAAWVLNHERPSGYDDPSIIDPEIQSRYNVAAYWYNYLSGHPPTPPTPPTSKHKMPLWMMLRHYY